MGLFSRKSGSRVGHRSDRRADRRATTDALQEWIAAHRGVEVFVEPRTSMSENTILLVAHDGEFTRRRVPSPDAAQQFAHKNGLPIYDATQVGYPQRMRDYSHRQTILKQREQRRALGD